MIPLFGTIVSRCINCGSALLGLAFFKCHLQWPIFPVFFQHCKDHSLSDHPDYSSSNQNPISSPARAAVAHRRVRDVSEMSRNRPAPTRKLHRPGNNASGYVQAPTNLPHQAFITAGSRQSDSDRRYSSSGSSSSGRHAGERAVDGYGRQPRLPPQQPTLGSSPELGHPQNSRDSARLSPINSRTALMDRCTTSVSTLSHPACLIPGYHATSQEAHQNQEQVSRTSGFSSVGARISDVEVPTLDSAARELLQEAVPSGASTGTGFGIFGADLKASTATAAGANPAQ